MKCNLKAPISGPVNKVLDLALTTLLATGFQLTNQKTSSLSFSNPQGLVSTKQNPLLGASKIELSCSKNKISLNAKLDAADKLSKFLLYFPPVLIIGLTLVLGLMTGFTLSNNGYLWVRPVALLCVINLSLWYILAFYLNKMIYRRTEKSLHTFLNSISVYGKA